jgi:hypothetical protein
MTRTKATRVALPKDRAHLPQVARPVPVVPPHRAATRSPTVLPDLPVPVARLPAPRDPVDLPVVPRPVLPVAAGPIPSRVVVLPVARPNPVAVIHSRAAAGPVARPMTTTRNPSVAFPPHRGDSHGR